MKKRFKANRIYNCKSRNIVACQGRYKYVIPTISDNGQFYCVDCWIVDKSGNVNPGYNVSPVPVNCDNIKSEL